MATTYCKRRPAFTVIELTAAAILAAALLAMTLTYVGQASRARHTLQTRARAVEMADNLMEQLFAWRYDELTKDNIAAWRESESFSSNHRKLDARIVLSDADHETLAATQILIEVSWKDHSGQQPQPVRLTAWRYRHRREQAP